MADIVAKHVNVFLDRHPVLKEINLNIPSNKITAVIGPNGSGKSTLLKVLAGLIKPRSGEIYLDNKELKSFGRK